MKQEDKLYICVREDFPNYMTPTLVAHAVLRHHMNMEFKFPDDRIRYDNWLKHSFKKCVVRVNQKEYDKIMMLDNVIESWENNTLNGEGSCLTVIAHKEEHNVLKFAKLWNVSE